MTEGVSIDEVSPLIEMVLSPAVEAVADMTMKEEEILFPMSMDKLTDAEWYEIDSKPRKLVIAFLIQASNGNLKELRIRKKKTKMTD
ncbi:MAG: hypothetical protein R2764_13750 [Bacteroidales bacterium]